MHMAIFIQKWDAVHKDSTQGKQAFLILNPFIERNPVSVRVSPKIGFLDNALQPSSG